MPVPNRRASDECITQSLLKTWIVLRCTDSIDRVFGIQNMCSALDRGDRTAKAVIRDEALRLFAEHGPDAVSLRRVASAAGVSPGLVVHHFASKRGLRQAVDAHVAAIFDGLFAAMPETDELSTTAGASLAEILVGALPPDSPVPAYLRRLWLSGDAAGQALLSRMFAATQGTVEQMTAGGIIRHSDDPAARAAFLMANDLAVLLLRDQLTVLLGIDPLTREGMTRWARVGMDVYRDGLFTDAINDTDREAL
ncbi:MAG: TetR family transcriptional regulator [Actinocatenispora sp.]